MKIAPILVAAATLAGCGAESTSATTPPTSEQTATPSAPAITPTATANPATDAYPIMASLDGHLTGPWKNTTFGTSGTMTWDVTSDATHRTVTLVITLTGNVLGAAAPAVEHIELTRLATGQVAGPSAAFGTVNGNITADGHIHMTLTKLPETSIASVDVTGTVTQGTSIAFAYSISFTNGTTAKGTATLTKQ